MTVASLLDLVPADWIAAWSHIDADFSVAWSDAREWDVARLQLLLPGPLSVEDIAAVERADDGDLPDDLAMRVVFARLRLIEEATAEALAATEVVSVAAAVREWAGEWSSLIGRAPHADDATESPDATPAGRPPAVRLSPAQKRLAEVRQSLNCLVHPNHAAPWCTRIMRPTQPSCSPSAPVPGAWFFPPWRVSARK